MCTTLEGHNLVTQYGDHYQLRDEYSLLNQEVLDSVTGQAKS